MNRRGRPPHPDVLTPRQWQVLALLREGLSNEQIALCLGISIDGVKFHLSEILSKLAPAAVTRRPSGTASSASRRRPRASPGCGLNADGPLSPAFALPAPTRGVGSAGALRWRQSDAAFAGASS